MISSKNLNLRFQKFGLKSFCWSFPDWRQSRLEKNVGLNVLEVSDAFPIAFHIQKLVRCAIRFGMPKVWPKYFFRFGKFDWKFPSYLISGMDDFINCIWLILGNSNSLGLKLHQLWFLWKKHDTSHSFLGAFLHLCRWIRKEVICKWQANQ